MEGSPVDIKDSEEDEEQEELGFFERPKPAEETKRSWPDLLEVFKKPESKEDEAAKTPEIKLEPVETRPEALLAEDQAEAESPAEVEPAAQAVPLEELSEAEVPVVEQQLVPLMRGSRPEAETANDPEAALADKAAEDFLDKVASGMGSDAAYQETMDDLGVEDAEPFQAETPEASENDGVEADAAPVMEAPAAESPAPADEDVWVEDEPILAASSPEGPPDLPPAEEAADDLPLPPPDFGRAGDGGGGSGNVREADEAFDRLPGAGLGEVPTPAPANEYYYRGGHPATFALVGGIIGYLIGRRRGRIKTEKKLLPVQKKLEKQVEDLQWQLKAKEDKIRKTAAEKVRAEGPAVIEDFDRKLAEKDKAKDKAEAPKLAPPVLEKPESPQMPDQITKAEQAVPAKGASGHIGQVLVAGAETARPKAGPENARPTAETGKPAKPEAISASSVEDIKAKNINRTELLSRAELLTLSEKIMIDGSSLRQIYETHLVGERGLRRLIDEHFKGGDLKRALRREVVDREIDFERDPSIRDFSQTSGGGKPLATAGGAAVTGKPTLDEMVQKASAGLKADNEEAAFLRARANFEAQELAQHKQHRRLVDIVLGLAIAGLGTLVIVLLLRG